MNAIKKCIDELKKEKPNVQYILGVLETYYEMEKPLNHAMTPFSMPQTITSQITNETTKEDIPAHLQPGSLGNIH